MDNGSVSDWKAVKGSAVQGAITGGAVGFTGVSSLLVTSIVAGGANAVGGITNRSIQSQKTIISDVATDAAIGAGLNLVGAVAGKIVENSIDNLSPAAKGKLGEAATQVKYEARGYRSKGKSNVPTGGRTPTGRRQVARYDHEMENIVTGSRRTVESKFNSARLSRNQRAARGNILTPGGLIVDRTTSQQFGDVTRAGLLGVAGQFNKKEE